MKIKKSQKIKHRSALGMKGEIVMAFKFEKDKFYMPMAGAKTMAVRRLFVSTIALLRGKNQYDFTLISKRPMEDAAYGIDQICSVIQEQTSYSRFSASFC